MSKYPSQAEFIMTHFRKHPKQELAYDDWTDELAAEYKALTGKKAYHLRSVVRRLYGEGKLLKVKNGVYKYVPDAPIIPRPKRKRNRTGRRPKIYNEPIYCMFKDSLFSLYLCGLKTRNENIIDFYQEVLDACRKYERVM